MLPTEQFVRYIRVHVLFYHSGPGLRFDLYGCYGNKILNPNQTVEGLLRTQTIMGLTTLLQCGS